MSKPFDATLKDLAADYPRDFAAAFAGETARPVQVLNVDLSTVTTAADFLVGIGEPVEEVCHIDFQSGPDEGKHADVLAYNALVYRLRRVPVHSVVVLLRPQAAHPNLSGAVSYARPGRGCKMDFGYDVVKLWEQPAEGLLRGGPGTLPLAMLGRLPEGVAMEEALRGVAQRVVERLEAETSPEQTRRLVTAAFVLTGLRVTRAVSQKVFSGVRTMRDSDTYLAIMDEGREAEAKQLLLLQGQARFGALDEAGRFRLEGITDLERLRRMAVRVLTASGWSEVLDTL
jgi:hypothetical protein